MWVPLFAPQVSASCCSLFFVQHNHCHSASDLTVRWWSFLWMWGLQGAALAEEPVRPVIPFEKVLERFLASEVINGFLSPATGARGARCSAPYNPCHPAACHHPSTLSTLACSSARARCAVSCIALALLLFFRNVLQVML